MLSSSCSTLAASVAASRVHAKSDFIDDGSGKVETLALLEQAACGCAFAYFYNKTVVLAMPGQAETIAALTALDGVARRLILWPRDRPADQLASTAEAADIDDILTTWPPDASLEDWSRAATERGGQMVTDWILFTSGTTGQPKMVVHTFRSLAGHITSTADDAPRPVWCTFYDMRRYGGLQIALRALIGGGSLVLSNERENMAAFLARAKLAGATHFLGTPSHWRLALMAEAQEIIDPVYIRLSGEVADQPILDALSRAFPKATLVHAFASTEAGLAFEVTDRKAGFPASLLMCADGPTLRARDGMLQVRSERGARGILDGHVTPISDEEGFIATGDTIEPFGDRYVFVGRRDGIVNVGGQKVFPEEVESIVNQHPAVRMSRVSARRNAITGAVVTAEIVRHDASASTDQTPLSDDVIKFCRERLPKHKVPVSVKVVTYLEVAPSGKLVRHRA